MLMRKVVCAIIVCVALSSSALAATGDSTESVTAAMLRGITPNSELRYYIRFYGGDEITGAIVALVDDEKEGQGIKLKTAIGTATIYVSQIAELRLLDESYRHNHRVFLLPTAEPISNNHFVGNLELLALWGGFGIGNVASFTLARTFLPGIPSSEQVSYLNAKATVYQDGYENFEGKFSIAVGGNLAWVNSPNKLQHIFTSATFTRVRSRVTGTVFMNLSGSAMDIFTIRAGTYGAVNARYASGSVGIGIGVDTRFSNYRGLHFIGELWNSDLTRPTNSVVVLGLRVANTSVSADFGLAVFSAPAVVPVMSFAWTPF